MTPADLVILHSGTTLSVAGLTGLAARGRAGRCVSFTAYLACLAVASLLTSFVSDPSWRFWLTIESVQGLLTLAVVFELALRMLVRLPRAAALAGRALGVVLALTLLGTLARLWVVLPQVLLAPSGERLAYEISSLLLPLVSYGAAFLCTALLAVANWYLLPLDPLHRGILVGFSVYLVLFSALLISLRGGHDQALSRVNSSAFLLLLGAWNWAAWRLEPPEPAPADVVRRLWPWR